MNPLLLAHIIVSFLGIFTGIPFATELVAGNTHNKWTWIFLSITVLTSLSGFILPAEHFMPSHAVGIISIVVLGAAIYALQVRKLAGRWRTLFTITSMIAFYLNAFVLVAQSFAKVPALKALAPTQSEPPFAVAQAAVLIFFLALGRLSLKRARPNSQSIAA